MTPPRGGAGAGTPPATQLRRGGVYMAQRCSSGAELSGGHAVGTRGRGWAQMPLLQFFKMTVTINPPRPVPPGVTFLLKAM